MREYTRRIQRKMNIPEKRKMYRTLQSRELPVGPIWTEQHKQEEEWSMKRLKKHPDTQITPWGL